VDRQKPMKKSNISQKPVVERIAAQFASLLKFSSRITQPRPSTLQTQAISRICLYPTRLDCAFDDPRDDQFETTVQVMFEKIQMQWFVTARRSDGGQALRMPFFFRPGRSLPASPAVVTTEHTDTLPAATTECSAMCSESLSLSSAPPSAKAIRRHFCNQSPGR
jgi:hypothetical protein